MPCRECSDSIRRLRHRYIERFFCRAGEAECKFSESTFGESLTRLFGYGRQFGRRQQLLLCGQCSGLEWKRRGAFISCTGSHSGWHEHELCRDSKVKLSGVGFGLPRLSRRDATDALPNRFRANDRSVFIDTGLAPQPIGPPDASFDHASFYYRYQYAGPYPTTIHSANTIGWDSLGATSLVYSGKAAGSWKEKEEVKSVPSLR